MNDKEFLQWIYYRLVEVHGENKNYDYMHRLKEIIDTTEVVKKSNDIQNVSERVQRIATYFAKKNPTPTKWANDILEYILEGSKHDR